MDIGKDGFKVSFNNGKVEVIDPNLVLEGKEVDFSGVMSLDEIVGRAGSVGFKMRDFMNGQPGSNTFVVVLVPKATVS